MAEWLKRRFAKPVPFGEQGFESNDWKEKFPRFGENPFPGVKRFFILPWEQNFKNGVLVGFEY